MPSSTYCTHADMASPPVPRSFPVRILKPGGREKRHVGLAHQAVLRQRHNVVREVPGDNVLVRDAFDVRSAAQSHDHEELILEHVHHADDAPLAVRCKGVEHRATDADAGSAQCDRLEDVGTAADASVNEDREVLLALHTSLTQGLHHLRQDLDAGTASVELATAMIGEHAAGQSSLVGHHSVLGALHALQEDLHLGDALEPRHIVPAEAWVDVAANGARGPLGAVHFAFFLIVSLNVGALLCELVTHVLLSATQLRRIHSDEERLHSRGLELLHILLRTRALRVDIELREQLLTRRAGSEHLVQGV
mmetsp:Transcript_21372/g.43953  ORF Transcript_21372/g.43953 Transcript_21372/m.43953 type:complete len:307 (+) Transcript_21372:374-1294(+)